MIAKALSAGHRERTLGEVGASDSGGGREERRDAEQRGREENKQKTGQTHTLSSEVAVKLSAQERE